MRSIKNQGSSVRPGRKYHRALELSAEAEQILLRHKWPGNVRELENLVQGLLVTCKGNVIKPQDIPFANARTKAAQPQKREEPEISVDGRTFKEIMKEYENRVLVRAMERWGNIAEVARHFKIDRSTVFRKVKELERQGLLPAGQAKASPKA